MIISDNHKFIFMHIPKTGGSTLHSKLKFYGEKYVPRPNCGVEGGPHILLREVSHPMRSLSTRYKKSLTAIGFLNYYKFTFVRNPWDWTASWYFYKKNISHHRLSASKYPTFKSWLIDPETYNYSKRTFKWSPGYPQLDWLLDKDGNTLVDFVGRFENLQEDFNKICDKIGIPRQDLAHLNQSKHKHYTEYYDEETKQIVAEKCVKDIKHFGYEFGK